MYGWGGQRIKVYLTEGKIVKEELPEELRLEYIGGRGFNSKTIFDEVRPGADPLGPENVFSVGIGPLAGTLAPGTARWTVTSKSPQTGLFCDGNGGGHFAAELKFAGYDQIIFYGRSPKPVYLYISDDQVQLRDASHLWGKTTWETHNQLLKELGERKTSTLTIGPAGENLVRIAKIMVNTNRAGGKGGMGAVLGSKNVKAIAVHGTGSVKIARPKDFTEVVKETHKKLMAASYAQSIRDQGTLKAVRGASQKRALTTRNAQAGYFEGWEKLTWEAFESQYAVKHKACFSCPVACSHYYQVKDGPYATHGYSNEYGTLYPFTSKLGSDNLAASLLMTTMCDQLGVDTHGCGSVLSFAMEAWQRGLLTSKDTDGLDLSWGNVDSAIKLIRKIAYREGFGNILAEGTKRASRQIKGSETCLVEVKGYECSSYYPGEGERKIIGLAFATAPVGGSHHRGGFMGLQNHPRVRNALGEAAAKRLSDPQVYEGQGVALAVESDFVAALNSLEACLLLCIGGLDENDLARLFSTATGVEVDGDYLLKVGERVFDVEKAFGIREGLRRKDDTLPERFFVEQATPWGITGINRAKFQVLLDEYYRFRGWNSEGIPTKKKLDELNLGYIAEQIGAV